MIATVLRQCARGLRDLRRHPWAQALTLAAVTLVAFLGGLFLLVLFNLDQQLIQAKGNFAFQVYWESGADMDIVRGQWSALDNLPRLTSKRTYTPDQALEELAGTLKGGLDPKVLAGLKGDNPLPPTALLYFQSPVEDPESWSKGMRVHLQGLEKVASVHFNPLQVDFARSWLAFSHRVLWPLICFLGLVVALVVGNTIKLSLLSRRGEVEILRLVGASRWYIQLPLLAGGAAQGLLGGSLALAGLKGVQLALKDLFNTPPLMLEIRFIPLGHAAALVGIIVVVSVVASWVAIRD